MFDAKLDHVAIACTDPEKLKRVLALIGCSDLGSEPVESQKVVTHFQMPKPHTNNKATKLELLVPTDPNGTVGKFIAKKGTGIHHISFEVKKLEELMALLSKNSIRVIYEKPQPGAHNMKVNFIHPESTGGVLIEISEKM